MTHQTKTYILGAVGLIILVGLIWWGQVRKNVVEPDTIKIGVIGTLTGIGSHQGQEELRGLEMAREEINVAGGINGRQIELIVEDSRTEPPRAVSALQKLITVDQVKFVVGDSFSTTTVPLIPIVNEQDVVLIAPNVTLNQLSQDDMFFRVMPTTKDLMTPLADYAYTKLGARRVGILRQDSPFGVEHATDFRIAFEQLGGEIVGEESFALTATDVRSEITKIKSAEPDAVLNLHTGNRLLGLVMKQAQELGLEDIVWLSHFGAESGVLVSEYGETVNDLVYVYPYDARSSTPKVEAFTDKYRTRYGNDPDFNAPASYDILQMLALAIGEVGEDPEAVKHFLLDMDSYSGASGTISFDENGDVCKSVLIKKIQSGNFVTLAEVNCDSTR